MPGKKKTKAKKRRKRKDDDPSLTIWVPELQDRKDIRRAAAACGRTMSNYIARAAVKAAREELGK